MRRQTQGGRPTPAGSSRAERLDPFTLPVRFAVSDKAADERLRFVELSRERVVLRRAVHGIKMAVKVPVAAYLGVAIRMEPPAGDDVGAVSVVLEHRDPGLSLPLYRASDGAEIVAEWQSWARVLGMPLLVAEADGRLREPFERIGAVRVATPCLRRRRRTAVKSRRPTLPLRRRPGRSVADAAVHRGEREIIARN
ncbi:MAG: hypothetical protein QOC56_1780 [Alphaproteobacteria bacterium]|nr:hypothetical protein [Alphaproteobacteria bacterium]